MSSMKRFDICIHTSSGDDLTITIEADTQGEVIGTINRRMTEEDSEFVRFGAWLVKRSVIDWIWVTPKGGT